MLTKTAQGLALIDKGLSVRQAAREVDISESALHAAIKRRKKETTGHCQSCGQWLSDTSYANSRPMVIEQIARRLEQCGAKAAAELVRKEFGGA